MQNLMQNITRNTTRFFGLAQTWLDKFNIPVTIAVPDELINRICGLIKPIIINRSLCTCGHLIQFCQNPPVFRQGELFRQMRVCTAIHFQKTCRIPQFGCKITVGFNPRFRQFQITPLCGHSHKGEA